MTATKIFEEDEEFPEGDRWEPLAWDVPKSAEFPEGLKYSFQYLGQPMKRSFGTTMRTMPTALGGITVTTVVRSKPFEDHKESVLDRAERWEKGEKVRHVVNFQDASRLQRILTPRHLELARSLMDAPAESMRSLADRLGRDVRQVHDDLHILNEYRIVHFREEDGAKKPYIPYDTVKIEVELSKSLDNTSESSASA